MKRKRCNVRTKCLGSCLTREDLTRFDYFFLFSNFWRATVFMIWNPVIT